jgi:putative ABC transport system ATP-binding protein
MLARLFKNNKNEGLHPQSGQSKETEQHLMVLKAVDKIYQSTAGRFTALKDVNLHIEHGEFVSIIGKSGSGKSTLINVVTGIDRVSAGEVWVNGSPVHQFSEEQIAIWRGRNVGVIFQFFQLLPTLTAVENIMLAMDYGKIYPRRQRPERALALLEQVEMAAYAHRLPLTLSGGQRQSIAIARAMANNPPILTADEPTGNLDSRSAEMVLRLFEKLVSEGKTILMVTHDNDLAVRAHRTIKLADGKNIDEWYNNGHAPVKAGDSHVQESA